MAKHYNDTWFHNLWDKHYHKLYARIFYYSKNEELTREALNLSFTSIYFSKSFKILNFESDAKEFAYIFTVAKREITKLVKYNPKIKFGDIPQNSISPNEIGLCMEDLIKNLNTREIKLLELISNYPEESIIAEEMSVSISSLRGTILRLKQKIIQILML